MMKNKKILIALALISGVSLTHATRKDSGAPECVADCD